MGTRPTGYRRERTRTVEREMEEKSKEFVDKGAGGSREGVRKRS
jgi:hypothetical protein